MKNLRYYCIIVLASLGLKGLAMDVKGMFVSMPDSMVLLIDRHNRETLVSYAEPEADTCSVVKNIFGSESWISHIDDNLIVFHPSQVRTIEMRVMGRDNGDSVLCVIDTYLAPEKESRVTVYDGDWSRLSEVDLQGMFSDFAVEDAEDEMLGRYSPLPDIRFVSAAFATDDVNAMVVTLSLPMLNEGEKSKQKAENMQRKLNWDGNLFK